MQVPARPPPASTPSRSARIAALLALLLGLALTALTTWKTAEGIRKEAALQFNSHADDLAAEIHQRLGQAAVGLRGARAMILANGGIDRLTFRRYVAERQMQRDFPGIRAFGFAERVQRQDLAAFVARERADHAPDFQLRDSGEGTDLLVVRFIEPHTATEGLNFGTDPLRREAAERAIATGDAAITAPVVLVLGAAPGWVLFVPVYRAEPPAAGGARRLQQLLGLLYAPIAGTEVLGPLQAFADGQLRFRVVDREARSEVLFENQPAAGTPMFQEQRQVAIGGRTLSVDIASTPAFEESIHREPAFLTALAGAALSLLLSMAILRLMQGRERAEAQAQEVSADLRQRERLIGLISEGMPARLSYWDRDLRCRLANPRFAAAFGRAPREMIGVRFEELIPAAHRAPALARARAALDGVPGEVETDVVPGTTAIAYYVPDPVDGEVRGFFVFALDVTALKQAEAAARRANAAKSQFLSNISHEIRTPLNAVLGMLALLRMTPLDARQGDYAGKAEASARSLLALLNDVLDFSKIEAGKMTLDPRPFSFQGLLEDLRVILSANLGGRRIALRFELDPAVPTWLEGDDMRLRQILINLGGNAIKFTHAGQVTLGVALVERGADEALVEVSVSDTGIGISLEDQQRIFADFTQASSATTREFGGTGLGLGICSRLAALMGSRLQVDSTPGQGSRFHFRLRLPIANGRDVRAQLAAPAPLQPAPAAPQGGLEGCRLLLVEDNALNQQVARELLAAAGAEVQIAGNGREAVLAVAGGHFDAVLMDIQMPVMDGFEATRAIRHKLLQKDLPIIAMTANAMESDREQCRAAGMDDHVAKPFVPAELVATLRRHLGREAAAAPAPAPVPAESASAPAAAAIDRAAAIARLGGDEDLYRRLIPSFRSELRNALAQLARPGELPRADSTRLLHTLKSTAATLGANELSRVAAAAEQASKDGQALDERLLAPVTEAARGTLAAFEGEGADGVPREAAPPG